MESKAQGASVYDTALDPREWAPVIGSVYLNHDMKVQRLKDIRFPRKGKRALFIKPLLAAKAIDGNVYKPPRPGFHNGLKVVQRAAERHPGEYPQGPAYPYPGTLMLVAKAKKIPNMQYRFWWVGGTLICDQEPEDFRPKCFPTPKDYRKIDRIFRRLYQAMGQPIMTADFLKWGGRIRMIEMNGPNYAGGASTLVVNTIAKWLAHHGSTVKENLKGRKPPPQPKPPPPKPLLGRSRFTPVRLQGCLNTVGDWLTTSFFDNSGIFNQVPR